MKIWLPPYLSVRKVPDGLRLGTLPPLAITVPDAPDFLDALLAELARPVSEQDAVAMTMRHSGWSREDAATLIADLREAGVLVPAWDRGDRYDRHRLYYRMLGADDLRQDRLAAATVGLIGMGGIGTHLATHLAAAGVGALVVTDGDHVELGNLTRQTLFTESDVGRQKVTAAEQRLLELRSDLRVETVPRGFDGPDLAEYVAGRCDIVLLSADRPAEIHSWLDTACGAVDRPWSASGYIEGHGTIGPLLHPPHSRCFACIRVSAEALPGLDADPDVLAVSARELNPAWQAPSFGPLNAMVAAIQANEAIRYLIGEPAATLGRRMLIDSRDYAVSWDELNIDHGCERCVVGMVSERELT